MSRGKRRFGKVLITGASSGIGHALALELAEPGTLFALVARRKDRLDALKVELEGQGATALVFAVDVRDSAAMGEVARQFIDAGDGPMLAVANSGISKGDALHKGDPQPMNEVFTVNVLGAINTLAPLIPHMMERREGHLAVVGSVAGFRGLPGKGAYCASKAAVKTLMDAYRPALRAYGIKVTTIAPGWVVSEMTADNSFRMPFLMDTDRAARIIADALARGKRNCVFPWQMRLALPLIRRLPDWILSSRV